MSTLHAKVSYCEWFIVKIRSDDGLFDRLKLVTLKLMYMLCKTVFSNVITADCMCSPAAVRAVCNQDEVGGNCMHGIG
jgi:hypothetical protein